MFDCPLGKDLTQLHQSRYRLHAEPDLPFKLHANCPCLTNWVNLQGD